MGSRGGGGGGVGGKDCGVGGKGECEVYPFATPGSKGSAGAALTAVRPYPRAAANATQALVLGGQDTDAINTVEHYLFASPATKGAVDIATSPPKTPVALANAVNDAQRAVEVFRNTVATVRPAAKEVK